MLHIYACVNVYAYARVVHVHISLVYTFILPVCMHMWIFIYIIMMRTFMELPAEITHVLVDRLDA